MEDETREVWLDKHSKRKQQILQDLKKYFKVRNKSKVEILNLRFYYEIQRLQAELRNINELISNLISINYEC